MAKSRSISEEKKKFIFDFITVIVSVTRMGGRGNLLTTSNNSPLIKGRI